MNNLARRIADRLIDWRLALFVLAAVAGTVAYFPAQEIQFDHSIENMFAPDDPLVAPYRKLKRTFGGNEIVLAVYGTEDLFAY